MLPAGTRAAYALAMAGAVWLALWTTPVRLVGAIALVAGTAWMAAAPAPDLLVTGDGRHVAVRTPGGGIALLRDRTGDYVRDTLAEVSGEEGDTAGLLDELPRRALRAGHVRRRYRARRQALAAAGGA